MATLEELASLVKGKESSAFCRRIWNIRGSIKEEMLDGDFRRISVAG